MNQIKCEFCNSILSSKYILKTHLQTNKSCLELRNKELKTNFLCNGCNIYTLDKHKLKNHQEKCKLYQNSLIKEKYENELKEKERQLKEQKLKENQEKLQEQKEQYEKELKENQEQLQEQYEQKLQEKEKKYEQDLKEQQQQYEQKLQIQQNEYKQQLKEIQIKYEEKIEEKTHLLIEKLERLAEKSIDKPTTINNNIKNYFSTTQYIEDINQNDLKKKLYSSLTEYHYMHGQKGIAIVCTEEIIKKTKDKKPIMICTDINRRNYKHTDKNGNIKTDHQARNFIEKVSKPIKEVSKEIYESILSNIETEKDQLGDEDFDEKDKIRTREFNVMNKLIEINNFDDPKYNSEFMSELAILNK